MKNYFTSPKLHIYWTLIFWIVLATLLYLTLTPQPYHPVAITNIDKVFHFLAFCGFSFIFRVAFTKIPGWGIIIASSILGVTIEIIQLYIPNRGFSVADMIADILGVFCGLMLANQVLKYKNFKLKASK